MKSESYFIGSDSARRSLLQRISDLDIVGTHWKVTISDSMSKSARCRGLQWMWYTDVANSGMGSYDTKNSVHRAAKYRWAVPILLRDDEAFASIWPALKKIYLQDKEKMKYIVDNFVSTEGDGFAIGEYLTDFERYYRGNGVNLTQPEDGLLEWANKNG